MSNKSVGTRPTWATKPFRQLSDVRGWMSWTQFQQNSLISGHVFDRCDRIPWRLSTWWSWSSQRWDRRHSRHRWAANFSSPPPHPFWAKIDGFVCLVEVYLVSLKGRKVRRPWACLFLHPAASSSSCSPTLASKSFPSPFFPLSVSLWDSVYFRLPLRSNGKVFHILGFVNLRRGWER